MYLMLMLLPHGKMTSVWSRVHVLRSDSVHWSCPVSFQLTNYLWKKWIWGCHEPPWRNSLYLKVAQFPKGQDSTRATSPHSTSLGSTSMLWPYNFQMSPLLNKLPPSPSGKTCACQVWLSPLSVLKVNERKVNKGIFQRNSCMLETMPFQFSQ